ncbi:unnamed protein product [Schistocephalus solidus]|uniref:Transcription initiation factor TFIID subunit 10 n=2 Tax=Schistocephalus solidus TaxID=70667 RepID=A0A183TD81_SCHSO|nr:unnamed protein product [Schistocephalus solidus]
MTLGGPARKSTSLVGNVEASDQNALCDSKPDINELDLLNELYDRLNQIQPTIPDRVSLIMLESAGVRLDAGDGDVRLARLVSLAGQKFLSEILLDSMHQWRLANSQSTGLLLKQTDPAPASTPNAATLEQTGAASVAHSDSGGGAGAPSASPGVAAAPTNGAPQQSPKSSQRTTTASRPVVDKRPTLTVDCLLAALRDRGIQVARPPYYE